MRTLLAVFLIFSLSVVYADLETPAIEQKLGNMVPIKDIHLVDEEGQKKSLKDFAEGKPIVLALAFFECTSICNPFINGVSEYVSDMKGSIQPGRDFKLLTVSFDPREGHEMAKHKKENQFAAMEKPRSKETWGFLTGEQKDIDVLTEAVGFNYVKNGDGFLHKSALIVLSPNGKVVRYIPGKWREGKDTYFNHFTMDLAVSEAYKGIPGPTLSKILNVCFQYGVENEQYNLKVLQIMGALIMTCAILLFLSVTILAKKKPEENQSIEKEGSEK